MLVLVHLLSPTALGMVAFGTTIVTIGNFFADGGLGAALIRRGDHPTVDELRALLGFQLILAVVIALGVAVVGFQAGTTGAVTAIMAWSLPLLALRAPHAIALERALDYRPIAATDFAGVARVLRLGDRDGRSGLGCLGCGVGRNRTCRHRLGADDRRVATEGDHAAAGAWHAALDAGLRVGFQAVGLAALARGQGVNLVIAAAGGERLLGYWSVAYRLLQVPFWVFQALWRVSYPTMARLRAHGEDTRLTVERFARATALLSGAMLAPLAASAHIVVPALLGANWAPSAAPLPWASAGLVIAGPISVATAGYLYSEKDVRTPLVATVINGAVWIGLTAILLPTLGVAAVGIAWMVASWTEAAIFSRALHRAGVAVGRMIIVPVAAAVASALLAYATQTPLPTSLVPGITTAAVALAAYLALSYAFNRPDLLATARRVRSLT